MLVMVFVTDDESNEGTGPLLYVLESPDAVLPPHPRGLAWWYFATLGLDDNIFVRERTEVEIALQDRGAYVSKRLVR